MSTEFLYREKDGGACGLETYSLQVPGSFGGGPWALRPKRLQWLTNITAGFKIAALCQVHMHLSEKSNNFSGALSCWPYMPRPPESRPDCS